METSFSLSQPLASGVAGTQIVPELDVFLVLFPAEKNLLAAEDGREINQASVKVLNLYLALLKFAQNPFDVSHGFDPLVDRFAARVAAAGKQAGQTLIVPGKRSEERRVGKECRGRVRKVLGR